MKRYKRILAAVFFCLLPMVMFNGCNGSSGKITTGHGRLAVRSEEKKSPETDTVLYSVIEINKSSKQIIFEKIGGSSRQYIYYYSGATYVLDKYGKNETISLIHPGDVVELQVEEARNKIEVMQISDEVWSFEGVEEFSVDLEKGIFSIGSKSYGYNDSVLVISGGKLKTMDSLHSMDVLGVTGIGTQILTISVTKGHGAVKFTNAGELTGGYLTIGNLSSTQIKEKLKLTVREGTYQLCVANHGYGGHEMIKVRPGKVTIVDLGKYKQEQKDCEVTFKPVQEDAVIFLNGNKIKLGEPLTLSYGAYRLTVRAGGYDDWSGTLLLSAEKATVVIDLSKVTKKAKEEDSTADKDTADDKDKDNNRNNTDNNDGESLDQKDIDDILLGGDSNNLIGDVLDILTSD